MAIEGDTNGVVETCDDATANCTVCDWGDDGDGTTVVAHAQEHADATGHTVSVSGTYYADVVPD